MNFLVDKGRPRVQLRTERFTPPHSHLLETSIEHGGFILFDGLYCVQSCEPVKDRSLEWTWSLAPVHHVGQA